MYQEIIQLNSDLTYTLHPKISILMNTGIYNVLKIVISVSSELMINIELILKKIKNYQITL